MIHDRVTLLSYNLLQDPLHTPSSPPQGPKPFFDIFYLDIRVIPAIIFVTPPYRLAFYLDKLE